MDMKIWIILEITWVCKFENFSLAGLGSGSQVARMTRTDFALTGFRLVSKVSGSVFKTHRGEFLGIVELDRY